MPSFHLKIILFTFVASLVVKLSEAQTYTFTNAGAEGREGPTQEQINDNYSGTNLAGKVTINTRGIQEWVVPASGIYSIEAFGAQGGFSENGGNRNGAILIGNFLLTSNSKLLIAVGQMGGSLAGDKDAGGGGGTFVASGNNRLESIPLIIAGGGSGTTSDRDARPGSDTEYATGLVNPRGLGNGGGDSVGPGGGGWLTDGLDYSIQNTGGHGFKSISDPLVGGTGGHTDGGFGGGSSGVDERGNGAGGYTGGTGRDNVDAENQGGGGGGSYNSGTNQNNTAGANEGHGKVIITFLSSANEAPVISQGAGPLSKVSSEDTQVSWTASELNATDSDTNSAQLSWSLLSSPSNGTAVVDGNGSSPQVFTYQPDANYHGSDSFSVQVSDGDANDSITINLTINPADDPSVISGDTSGVLNEDSSVTGDLNATDIEGLTDGSYFSVSTAPNSGISSIDATEGNWTYSPSPNFYGNDSFTVTITDDDGNTSTQLISLTINPVDDPAVISGDTSGFLLEDSSLTGDLIATDIDGLTDGTYFSISSSPTSGSLSINPESGRWTYYPNSNTFGSESFTVTVTDDQDFTSIQEITLNVISVNDLTSISGDFNGTANEDNIISGDINATDIDGLTDGSYFSISVDPSNGVAAIDSVDGNWTYSPSANFYGSDSFTVTITDDQGYTASQIINLAVIPVDDPAIISGDTNASLTEDSFVSGDLNASDNDGLGDGSYFSINSTPVNGSASIDPATGAWSYSPSANFYGSDTFTVIITDDQGYSTSQIISLTVTPIDDQTMVTGEFSGKLYLDHNVSGDINASDIDGLTDGSYFSIATNPANGSAQIDPVSGQWTYSPNPGFLGDDSFTIQITDDQGYTTNQSITIIPQYNVAVAKTGQPTILDNGNALFSASIIYNGGLPVLEVGFLVSSTPSFTQSTKLLASPEQNSSAFSLEYPINDPSSTLYIRAFARNQNGETVSDIKRLNPQPIVIQWSSHATLLDTGWLQSDWFGTFYLYSENWVYHARLGWVYIPDSSEPGIWIWSSEHDWLWTQEGVYPHLYKNSTGAWIYLLNQKTQGKDFYDYQSGLFK